MTKPILCLVTDRLRLARAVGVADTDAIGALRRQLEGAVAAGVDLVQIRERDLDGRLLAALVRDAVQIARGTATRIVVNDRVDVAVAAGAAGVHLRETSIAPAAVRRLAPALLVGRSVHGVDLAANDRTAVDYFIAGTVFATTSKAGVEPIGVQGLAAIVTAAAPAPVLAIGGVTCDRLSVVVSSGAGGVAAIGAFIPAAPHGDIARAVQESVENLRLAFDSGSAVS